MAIFVTGKKELKEVKEEDFNYINYKELSENVLHNLYERSCAELKRRYNDKQRIIK